ncbi:MAG TPA: phosphate-starvation-inducible PsiE family protein [Candidatus Binatia bacterium]|nr:phosphate-starvation-inducible PsiE family protein [Candidatus Binatia bacterium]
MASAEKNKGERPQLTGARLWFTNIFSRAEDVVYAGLGLVLAVSALALLMAEMVSLGQHIAQGQISDIIVPLLDQLLLIVILVELLFTVKVSFREHVLEPSPFLVVGLVAVSRRIIVLSAELSKLIKEGEQIFQSALMELGLLILSAVALVFCLRMLRPRDAKVGGVRD